MYIYTYLHVKGMEAVGHVQYIATSCMYPPTWLKRPIVRKEVSVTAWASGEKVQRKFVLPEGQYYTTRNRG